MQQEVKEGWPSLLLYPLHIPNQADMYVALWLALVLSLFISFIAFLSYLSSKKLKSGMNASPVPPFHLNNNYVK